MEELKEYGVVVTTYQRLTNEQPRWSDSPLSRIYWLRMVLVSALEAGDVSRVNAKGFGAPQKGFRVSREMLCTG